MERVFSSRYFHLIAVAVITIGILLAYSNTFYVSFQFDDLPQIVENDQVRSLHNIPYLIKTPRGITLSSFALNYAIGELDVFGYHAVNTAIHIISSILAYFVVFGLLRSIRKDDDGWSKRIAAFSALLFALHPVQTQAITYIVQRMESLSSLFYLLAVLFFIKSAGPSAGKKWLFWALTCVAYILAFYSKETAITLPAVILLLDYFIVSRGELKGVASKAPVYAALSVLLVFFAFSTMTQLKNLDTGNEAAIDKANAGAHHATVEKALPSPVPEGPSAGFSLKTITPKEYLFTQFNVLTYYMALLVLPINQNLDYDFPISKGLFSVPEKFPGTVLNLPILPSFVSLVILTGIIILAVYFFLKGRKEGRGDLSLISFFIFWFFIILSPTSSFVPINDVIYEHRLYLPSLGFFVIAVLLIERVFGCLFGKPAKKA